MENKISRYYSNGADVFIDPPEYIIDKYSLYGISESIAFDIINSRVDHKQERISILRQLLSQSDFKVLPDYDGDNTTIKAQRYDWRNELRALLEQVQ